MAFNLQEAVDGAIADAVAAALAKDAEADESAIAAIRAECAKQIEEALKADAEADAAVIAEKDAEIETLYAERNSAYKTIGVLEDDINRLKERIADLEDDSVPPPSDEEPPADEPPADDGGDPVVPPVADDVSHGADLTDAHVGPAAIGITTFDVLSAPLRGYFRADDPSEFATRLTADTVIDGYEIKAGTYLVEGKDISRVDFYMTGGNSFVFRGCRGRGPSQNIGYWNCNGYTGRIWILHCDLGGPNGSTYHEVPIKIASARSAAIYRNRISFCTTGVQVLCHDGEIVENYISDLTTFGTDAHLNGTTTNGGQRNQLILRNRIECPEGQTDAVSFFQDFGAFPGTGSGGYWIRDNLLAGGGYTIYAGMNAGKSATSVQNMVVVGNRISTRFFPNGGRYGPITAEPAWGRYGNVKENNTWADGAHAGQSAF